MNIVHVDIYKALCEDPRVVVEGPQVGYVPSIGRGIKNSKELLAKLRDLPKGVPKEGTLWNTS